MTSIPWGGFGTLLKVGLIKAGEKIIVKQAEKEVINTVDKEIVNKLDKEIVEQLGKDATKGVGNPKIIRSVGNDILDIMESNGGHTLEKHVSKSNEDLIKRAIQEDVEAATCYTNKSTATKAVQENLRKNADEISKWLNEESTGKKIFDVEHEYSIGKGVLENSKQVMYNLSKSRVVLIRDSSSELGFRILTSFPLP